MSEALRLDFSKVWDIVPYDVRSGFRSWVTDQEIAANGKVSCYGDGASETYPEFHGDIDAVIAKARREFKNIAQITIIDGNIGPSAGLKDPFMALMMEDVTGQTDVQQGVLIKFEPLPRPA